MGKSESKLGGVTHEEAVRKVTEDELSRLHSAFKRSSHAGYMNKAYFVRDMLTDVVPVQLGNAMYDALATSSRGISEQTLVTFLVVLTSGTTEQRMKLLFSICSPNDEYVFRDTVESLILACDGRCPPAFSELFLGQPRSKKSGHGSKYASQYGDQQNAGPCDYADFDTFAKWATKHHKSVSFMHWILADDDDVRPSLSDPSDTPTFHQVMAGMTKLNDTEVADLERRYWLMKGSSKSGRLDLETFTSYITPPLPPCICPGFYSAMDTNGDGHLDFKELSLAIALCCRNPSFEEKVKFCFRIFDIDRDGVLNAEEQECLFKSLSLVEYSNNSGTAAVPEESVLDDLIAKGKASIASHLEYETLPETMSLDDFCTWAKESRHIIMLLRLIVELCHISLGLRPATPQVEGIVIRGWMARDRKLGLPVHTTWHLISSTWYRMWLDYTGAAAQQSNDSNVATKGSTTEYSAVSVPRAKDTAAGVDAGRRRSKDTGLDAGQRSSSRLSAKHKNAAASRPSVASSNSNSAASSAGNASSYVVIDDTSVLGQIENSSLCLPDTRKTTMILTTEGGTLRRGLVMDKDFTFVSEPVWKALLAWYNGGPSLPRTVISHNNARALELYLYNIKFFRHTTNNQVGRGTASQALSHVNTVFSWALGMFSVSGSSAAAARYPSSASSSRSQGSSAVSAPQLPRRYLAYYAALSRKTTYTQLHEFVQKALFLRPDDVRIWLMKDEVPTSLLEDEDVTLESLDLDGKSLLLEVRNKDLTWPEEILSFAASAKSKEKKEKKVTVAVHVEKGTTGLSNLGNTCFMNSAIQCISNTQPLSMYFCANRHMDELNRTNPLGMKGHVAKRYGELVQDLWSGTSKSIAPLKFRLTIARYAPRFNTFQQQDAQELLAFLLDGLHEDLNRITDKPYVELRDSEGRVDDVVAKEAWDYHQQRNQSVVVDLFHGQLKSTVRCLTCGNTNNRFDPFTFLSLPLPMEDSIYLEVILIRLDGSVPTRYAFRMSPESRYSTVMRELEKMSSVPVGQLFLVEVHGSAVKAPISEINKICHAISGKLHAYEVPAPALIQPTDRASSVDRINATERLESLKKRHSDQLARAAMAQVATDLPASESTLSPARASRTHAEVTSNEPTSCDGPAALLESSNGGEGGGADAAAATGTQPPENDSVTVADTDADGVVDAAASASLKPEANPHITDITVASPTPDRSTATGKTPAVSSPVMMMQPEFEGFVFALHRKAYLNDYFFLLHSKLQPGLFGVPIAVPCDGKTTHQEIYQTLLKQLTRLLVAPDPDVNVKDCGYQYPFVLKGVEKDGLTCSQCPWWRFCTGCPIAVDDQLFDGVVNRYLAIDWDSTALHLQYQTSEERSIEDDVSVKECDESTSEAISLEECLDAFTKEEHLGEDEQWYCSKCQTHRMAVKKLDIWRLPPILIVHVKRFQMVNSQWIKSQKSVKFPVTKFTPPSLCEAARSVSPESASSDNGPSASEKEQDQPSAVNGVAESQPIPESKQSPDVQRTAEVQGGSGNDSAETGQSTLHTAAAVSGADHAAASNGAGLQPRASLSEMVSVVSDPLSDEAAAHDIADTIKAEGLHDRLAAGEKIDDQTLALAQLNEQEPPPSTPPAVNNQEIPAASVGTSIHHTSPASGISPSESTQSATSRKSSKPTMAERLGTVDDPPTYNLFAMTTHQGILAGGHYMTFACHPNGKWYSYNDSTIKEIDRSRLDDESPYLLLYESSTINYNRCLRNAKRRARGQAEDDPSDDDDDLDRVDSTCTVV